jgi:hypothetical protein
MEGDGVWGYVGLVVAVALGVVLAGVIGGYLSADSST